MSYSSMFLGNRPQVTGHLTYLLNPRSLIQSAGSSARAGAGAGQGCWNFTYGERTSGGESMEVAELKKTNRLYLKGAVKMSELTPGADYKVLFFVKLKKGGYGWEYPVTVTLSVPGEERDRRRQVNLYEQRGGDWIEINVGEFTATAGGAGQVTFRLLQDGPHDKKGLVLKNAVVRPA